MTQSPPEDIEIRDNGDRIVIEIPEGHWEGTPAAAERLLTRLHYVLGRARPGTNIASMFVNGQLWGGKFIETNRHEALHDMRFLVDQLSSRLARLEREEQESRRDG
jgi:hypothetical protein